MFDYLKYCILLKAQNYNLEAKTMHLWSKHGCVIDREQIGYLEVLIDFFVRVCKNAFISILKHLSSHPLSIL